MLIHERAEDCGTGRVRNRHMDFLVRCNGKGQRFSQIGKGVGLLFADFIHDLIENGDGSTVFSRRPQGAKRNSPSNAMVVGVRFTDIFREHESEPPAASIVLSMSEYVPDVDLLPVVVNGCDQAELVASDVKDGEPIHLVCRRKRDPQSDERGVVGFPHHSEPMLQRGARRRVDPPEIHQPPSRDDVHRGMLSQFEICVKPVAHGRGIRSRLYRGGL